MNLEKLLISIIGVSLLITGCGNGKKEVKLDAPAIEMKIDEVESSKEEIAKFRDLSFGFAFANETGDRLITTMDDEIKQPETFNIAIGKLGEEKVIEYVAYQDETAENTYRQTSNNFANLNGYVYKTDDYQLKPNETYVLVNSEKTNLSSMLPLKSTRASETSEQYYQEVDHSVIERFEEMKNLKVIHSELLAETEDGGQVCLLQFERMNDEMLFSIIYINEEFFLLKDYPATYDEYSTWRVDSGDEPGLFDVLFIMKTDEGIVMGMTWAAPEGESAMILKETADGFEELELSGSRYWSP